MIPTKCVTVDAPAKINLGLEILGKRDDGFHELRSVMAMVDVADRLIVFQDARGQAQCVDGVSHGDNLVTRALDAFREAVPTSPRLGWSLSKKIPIASGLGGASSDAAAALLAANYLSTYAQTDRQLSDLAATLGSDVPFFLGSPLALSSGRGTQLEELPFARLEVLLIVPNATIPQKTRTLYSLIRESDYSDGSRAASVISALRNGHTPDTADLANSFSHQLTSILPIVQNIGNCLEDLGCNSYGVSGAGPVLYALLDGRRDGQILRGLRHRFGDSIRIIPTRTRDHPISVVADQSNV
jgi:4-diphosphocytidyl-2-C-methyl-D-erythritol kinase